MAITTGTALAIAAITMGVSGLATAGASLYSASQKPKTEEPLMKPKDKMGEEAARQEADLLRKRRGARASILTSPLGVSGTAPTKQTTLGA